MSLDRPGLSEDDLPASLDLELRGKRFNSSHHVVRDHTFLFGGVIVEAGRPTLESFKAEREGVLPRWETTALEDHNLASRKLVSSLIVSHLEVAVARSSDKLRSPVIKVHVILGLTVRYIQILIPLLCTSVLTSSCGGMAAMGSNCGGGGGWPGLWC